MLLAVAVLAIVGLLGTWAYQKWHDGRLWENFLARLRTEPGIVITETGERDGKWLVGGLRDPLAVDPQHVLRESSIDSARVVTDWRPYQSLHPEFVLKRAQEALAPPATVTPVHRGRSDRRCWIRTVELDPACARIQSDAAGGGVRR